ncbi:MAG: Nif3-like dinuclear metal center hexameric protein [Alistipes sp.]|nr:Nif3-like dinuclear metal center hexameric protein [Alistipes sp.]MBO7194439.1 Nif3-like dinuclear metal center hexameric protein [Alistipes sp.]
MKVRDITSAIESFAPLGLQESYDNSGLIVGRPDDEVNRVLLAVDVNEEVLQEAIDEGCDMIVTHHPIIFHPMKRFNSATYVERCVEKAIRQGIVLYAAHTNLDSTPEGMSWRVAQMVGLEHVEVLQPNGDNGEGFGVVGELAQEEAAEKFLHRVMQIFNVKVLRHSDIVKPQVRKVAICTGAGGSLIDCAREAGADIYLTADLKYNDFMKHENSIILTDMGHFESEYCAIQILFDILSKKIPIFAACRSVRSRNPVNYMVE